jgi:hypothetical protein
MNTYTNTKGNKIFISKGSWFVKADRYYGPVKSGIFYHGELFIDGKLTDSDYEISETRLNRYFAKVGA